jgi:hypothetical protein
MTMRSNKRDAASMLGSMLILGIVMVWGIGIFAAVNGGNNPGKVRRDILRPYPTVGVLVMCAIISVEAVGVYAILRPRSFVAHPRRAIAGLAVFVPVAMAEYFFLSAWTDQAGYCYANGVFLRAVLIYLVIAATAAKVLRVGPKDGPGLSEARL